MKLKATREGYVEGLLIAAETDARIVVIDGDVAKSIGTTAFKEKYPDRYFNLGIAEQNIAEYSAGLALSGFIPFYSTYAVFAVGRAFDQIRATICNMNLNVRIGGAHSGVSVGPDGATHQALEDLALTRSLPNMTVFVPADSNQTRNAVLAAQQIDGPVYIRFGRNPVPQIYDTEKTVKPGKGNLLRQGNNATIIAIGVMVHIALEAAEQLSKEGIEVSVVDMVSIKPLDTELLQNVVLSSSLVVTAEDHQITGGLFSAVSEHYSQHHPVRILPVAVQDQFGCSGTPEEVLQFCNLTSENIMIKVKTGLDISK